jgi:hypothetical protein
VQLVNTQKDNFDCEKNWKGLIIDTEPTTLTSPDGRFKVEATNTGARLSGPGGSVEVTGNQVKLNGTSIRATADVGIDILASGIVHIKGSQVQTEQGP